MKITKLKWAWPEQNVKRLFLRFSRPFAHWWRRYDRRYRWWWRAGNMLALLVVVAGIVLPVVSTILTNNSYKLSVAAQQLVGTSDPKLAKQLTWSAQDHAWQFNAKSVMNTANLPGGAGAAGALAAMRAQVGTPSGKGKDTSTYAVTLPQDLSQGITYTDTNTQLNFSLIPEFRSSPGRMVSGHIVYPLAGGKQAIYTLKNNGLKEDIFVPASHTPVQSFRFKLKLPDTLEARQLPDGSGGIGIYSADPSLYGPVTYGNTSDEQTVERARRTSQKINLVFALPAPAITAPRGVSLGSSSGRFEQSQTQLTVVAEDLDSLHTPLSIDPSVVVTSASDFATGNNEDNIDFSTSGQISRGGLTGGSVSTGWRTTTNISSARSNFATVVYHGFIYVLGGSPNNANNCYNDVHYAPLNADGTIGTWTSTTSFPNARQSFGAVAYNGYIYIMGGSTYTQHFNDVEYAPVNANGTLGAWKAANSLPTGHGYYSCNVTAYNGYLYACFGQYASINADGTLGTWQSTNAPSNAGSILLANNRYIYSITNGNGANTIQYASVNADGTVGSWLSATQSAEPSGPYWFNASVYDGYLYLLGGPNVVSYAAIMANGTLGAWQTTSSLLTGTYYPGSVAYNGYIYVLGGITSDGSNSPQSTVEYAKIDPAGATSNYTTNSTTIPSARTYHQSVTYNGYMYVMGGQSSGGILNDVQYAPINANGTVGAWSTTTSFNTTRTHFGAVASNGYMYVIGGLAGSGSKLNDVQYAPINANGTIGTWQYTYNSAGSSSFVGGFTNARYALGAVTYKGYLYVMGGYGSSGDLNDVQYAPINANGTIGTWQYTYNSAGSSSFVGGFTNARDTFGAVAYGGYLYIMGGIVGASNVNDVQYAPINANGTIGTWQYTYNSAGSASFVGGFTSARNDFSAVAYGGYLYIMGGYNGTLLNDVQYAQINANGTIGTWNTTTSFLTARHGLSAVAYGGYLYIVGGYGSNYLNDVQYAPINNGGSGTAGSWATNSTSFTTSREEFSSIAYNGYLYIMGGYDSAGTDRNDVQYAPINANGTIGTWQYTYNSGSSSSQTGGFTTARSGFQAMTQNGYLYILGGEDSSGRALNDVQYAPINANGTIGAWASTTSFSTARSDFSAVVYNGYVYVLGGVAGSNFYNDVQYAPINANGTIGAWASTTTLSTDRSYFSAIAYNGYLYVLGGYSSAIGNDLNDVQYAPINANGTIGAWASTTSFSTARSDFSAVVYNGYVYVLGGFDNPDIMSLNDVQYAPINANGTIGAWASTTSFSTARQDFDAAVSSGYLYAMGGFNTNTGNYLNSVEYTPLSSIARIAHYSKLIDLGSAVNVTGVTFNGTSGGGVSVSYRAAGTDGVFGTNGSVSNIAGTACTSNVASTRYLLLNVTLDDSYGQGTAGGFPDSAGTAANLTDLTVNYSTGHPPPNIRLRTGQTMQQGNLSSLDTCS